MGCFSLLVCFVFIISLFAQGNASTLYGYYFVNSTGSSGIISIDPQTGSSTTVCDLSSLPELFGAQSSSDTATSTLMFYTISAKGNISLVEIDPTTCKSTTTLVTGLNAGQDDVRDIKYDSANNMLYMVFPNPFCLHGSLDQMNIDSGAVISHLTNVPDPVGLGQTAALSAKTGAYYFVAIPIGAETLAYQLNRVDLTTGNSTTVTLMNNDLDVGDMWGSNYTLGVIDTANGVQIFGATSSATTDKQCSPSGFYTINPTTGNVTCSFGPIAYEVYPLGEFDSTAMLYYQLFNDASGDFYLITFDPQAQKVVATTPCKACSQVSILAALP